VLPLVSILMMIMMGFAGLAVDVRNGYVVRSMLQHAVDDGALSALRWSTQIFDSPTRGFESVSREAVREAVRVAQQELHAHGVSEISRVTTTFADGHLTLEASARVPTYFTALFGIDHWIPRARSNTMLWAPQQVAAPGGPPTVVPGPGVLQVFSLPPVPSEWQPHEGNLHDVPGGGWEIGGQGPGSPEGLSPDSADTSGPCNCDGIAAGDRRSAREALDRMGASPADRGPFGGDMTSEMGFGEMQSHAGGDDF